MTKFARLFAIAALASVGAFAQTAVTSLTQGAGTWAQKAPLPTARNEVSLATVEGKIYVLGGSINRVSVPHVEEYDPAARQLIGNFPQAFSHIGLINSAFNLTREELDARILAPWVGGSPVESPISCRHPHSSRNRAARTGYVDRRPSYRCPHVRHSH